MPAPLWRTGVTFALFSFGVRPAGREHYLNAR